MSGATNQSAAQLGTPVVAAAAPPLVPAPALAVTRQTVFLAIARDHGSIGGYARVPHADAADDVETLEHLVKDAWGADLAGVELRHMRVFGPLSAPTRADTAAALAGEPLLPNAKLQPLLARVAPADAFFVVRVDVPPPPADAAHVLQALRALQIDQRRVLAALETPDDASSFRSPTGQEYEEEVNRHIDAWLERRCGLHVVEGSRRNVAATDAASGGIEWDARFAVKLVPGWTPPPPAPGFLVYGGRFPTYQRPPAPPHPRELSPPPSRPGTPSAGDADRDRDRGRDRGHDRDHSGGSGGSGDGRSSALGGALRPPAADYLATLEYTSMPAWSVDWVSPGSRRSRLSLLPRLEQRLSILLDRARSAAGGSRIGSVLDCVAVVGVVSTDACATSVRDVLSQPTPAYPLLKAMCDAGRFVYFHFAAVVPLASPMPLSELAVLNASGADADAADAPPSPPSPAASPRPRHLRTPAI